MKEAVHLKTKLFDITHNDSHCILALFNNGNFCWYNNGNDISTNYAGKIDIEHIKLDSLVVKDSQFSFETLDECGYEFDIYCQDNQHVTQWIDAIYSIFSKSIDMISEKIPENQYSFFCPNQKIERSNNYIKQIKHQYDLNLRYQRHIHSKKDNIIKSQENIIKSQENKINDQKNQIFSGESSIKLLQLTIQTLQIKLKSLEKDLNITRVEHQKLVPKYAKLKEKEVKLPRWWISNVKKNINWGWKNDNDAYEYYGSDIGNILSKIKPGEAFYAVNEENRYELRKISEFSGIQTNTKTKRQRKIKCWDSVPYSLRVICDRNNKLIQDAFNQFRKTVPNTNYKLDGYTIQNKELYLKHTQLEKLWEDNKRCDNLNIKYLFHGATLENIKKIYRNGFNRIFNKRCLYGKGVYFARDAKYSLDYCDTRQGYKHLLFCRVICGDYCVGNKDMMVPKTRKVNNLFKECMVDKIHNPSIFVTTMDSQAYPLVVISVQVS